MPWYRCRVNSGPEVKYELHPRGNSGARKSVRKTVQAAAAGRLSPKVQEEAQRILKQDGLLHAEASKYDQAKALHLAVQQGKASIPDPVDAERIMLPDCLLADCDGLKFDAGDCDCKSAALAALIETVGITCAIVGQAFNKKQWFSHILIACEVEDGLWYYADAFTQHLAFGETDPPTREVWALVPSGQVLCDHSPSCMQVMTGVHPNVNDRPMGDSIYIGAMGASSEPDDSSEEKSSVSPLWVATRTIFKVAVLGLAGFGAYKLVQGD